MDKGIYTALSGGLAKAHELEIISNNLANVNTAGFKKDNPTFNEYMTSERRGDDVKGIMPSILSDLGLGRVDNDKSFVEMDAVYTDFSQGGLDRTKRDLDFAIIGKGFFEILTDKGVKYSKNGNFSIAQDGTLVTQHGDPVLKYMPNEKDPQLRKIVVKPYQKIQVTQDGTILQGKNPMAILSITEFYEDQWLEKSGNSYYRNTTDKNIKSQKTDGFSIKVRQGFLEASNVNPVKEMTRLIEATRAYESHMQAIKTYQEIDGKTANEIYKY